MTRTTTAYAQRPLLGSAGNPLRLFSVGANFTRSEVVQDPATGQWLPGYRLEPQRTNRLPNCNDPSAANWTVNGSVAITPNTGEVADPAGGNTAAKIVGLGDLSVDDFYDLVSGMGPNQPFSMGCWIYPITTTGVLRLRTAVSGNIDTDLSTLTTGQWTRIVSDGTVLIANGAGNAYINPLRQSGASLLDFYWWCGSMEPSTYYCSSPIVTADTAVTRTADSPIIWILAPTAERELTLLVPVLIPTHTPSGDLKLFSIYKDGAAGTDHITAWVDTAGKFKITSAHSGGASGALVVDKVISDGVLHWVSVHAKSGQLLGFVDSTFKAVDLGVTVAPDLDRLSYEPHGGWTGGCSWWRSFIHYMPRPLQPGLIGI